MCAVKTSESDPFGLEGKNPKRVAPQIRKNIELQRLRVVCQVVMLAVCLGVVTFGVGRSVFWSGLSIVMAVLAPFYVVGIFADRHLLKWQRQRLAECERRIREDED